jgi:hypothetical protein
LSDLNDRMTLGPQSARDISNTQFKPEEDGVKVFERTQTVTNKERTSRSYGK